MIAVLLLCVIAGFAIFWLAVRPFTRELETRIPTGAAYRPAVAPRQTRVAVARWH